MAKTKRGDHLYFGIHDSGYALICAHCGAVYVPAMPMSTGMFAAISRQFDKDHINCVAPASGALNPGEVLRRAGLGKGEE